MFWANLTEADADFYIAHTRRVREFVMHCAVARKAKSPIDESLRPTDPEYFRWNALFWRFWRHAQAQGRPTA